jgi:VWFA-related protein
MRNWRVLLPLGFLLGLALTSHAQQPRFPVEVDRVLIDARVVDSRGRAIRGLQREDFRVEVDGKAVTLDSVTWVSSDGSYLAQDPSVDDVVVFPGDVPGRLIVFLFQKDFEPLRAPGLLRLLKRAMTLVSSLGESDRVAVLSHDHRLKLWTDFTNDHTRLRRILERDILFEVDAVPVRSFFFPSLAEHFDAAAARAAASPEEGLLVLARALTGLPGAKSLVFFGWGLGRMEGTLGVRMTPDYEPARRALVESRTSVFALDLTDADYHSLEVGLQQVAQDTGGFYARTRDPEAVGFQRLEGVLAGHYVLAFEKPAGKRGSHRVNVRLTVRKGEVLARPGYEG